MVWTSGESEIDAGIHILQRKLVGKRSRGMPATRWMDDVNEWKG